MNLFGPTVEAQQMRRLLVVIGTLEKYQQDTSYKLGPVATALRLVEEEFSAGTAARSGY